MADLAIVNKLAEISETEQWRFIRTLLERELEKQTDINNLSTEADLTGAKKVRKVIEKVINQVDGAKNTIELNG